MSTAPSQKNKNKIIKKTLEKKIRTFALENTF